MERIGQRDAARRRRGRAGFTLLEMLAALTLTAILAMALYASLHTGFSARERAEETLEPVRAAGLALDLVGRDIKGALPPTGILAGEFVGLEQTAAADSSRRADTLVLHIAGGDAAGDVRSVRRIEFALVTDEEGSGNVLVRRVTENLLAPETSDPVEEVLCRGAASFTLRYFDGTVWEDSWDSTARDNALPLAVEAEIEIGSDANADGETERYAAGRLFLLPCAVPPSATGAMATAPR